MRAEIVSIGTELLLGEITDTNASYLAGQLPMLGLDLYWVSQVGDNKARLTEVLQRAWQRSDITLTTGGLGPTEDDITRDAIAEMLGEELRVAPDLEHEIRGFFTRRDVDMPPSNIKQATLIPSAVALHNVRGTAPGWWVERGGHIIIAMPGPPAEMQHMWQKEVLPKLQQRFSEATIFSKTFKTFGLGEAAAGEMVSLLLSSANPTLGIYAKADGVHLRLTAKARKREEAEAMISQGEVKVRAILGQYIWGTDNDTLEAVVGRLLTENNLSLAVMESCSGGLLATTITDASGSSAYFRGGLIANSNETKVICGVDAQLISNHGAISAEVAQAMAGAARLHLGADIGVSTSDVAGPEETEGKPMGTAYIGIDDGKSKKAIKGNYPGDRLRVKRLTTTAALVELKKTLDTLGS